MRICLRCSLDYATSRTMSINVVLILMSRTIKCTDAHINEPTVANEQRQHSRPRADQGNEDDDMVQETMMVTLIGCRMQLFHVFVLCFVYVPGYVYGSPSIFVQFCVYVLFVYVYFHVFVPRFVYVSIYVYGSPSVYVSFCVNVLFVQVSLYVYFLWFTYLFHYLCFFCQYDCVCIWIFFSLCISYIWNT